jgi:hypothetical protein
VNRLAEGLAEGEREPRGGYSSEGALEGRKIFPRCFLSPLTGLP